MKTVKLLFIFTFYLFLSGCGDEEAIEQPISINFLSEQLAIGNDTDKVSVEIVFSRAASSGGNLTVTINSSGLSYGLENDFYTSPELLENELIIPFVSGAESVIFDVFKGKGLNIESEEIITVQLSENNSGFQPGSNNAVNILFSENFVAPSGLIELSAGSPDFEMITYADLSKINTKTIDKYSWDLGFYNKSGEFYVVLNSQAATMARPLLKTDLNSVQSSDTLGFGNTMSMPPPGFDPSIRSVEWIDSPDGNLETAAIGSISVNDSENPVFIIKRDGERSWKKVRITRSENGYNLDYANINASSFESLTIDKNNDFNFVQVHLDQGIVESEPEKSRWDLKYGTYSEFLNLGAPGLDIPYEFKDYIVINRYNTSAAMVLISDISYEDFEASDLQNIVFSTDINSIGSNWRQGGGPNSGPSLLNDRFFVIKDSDGNVYKLMFTRLTSTSGERGFPEFKYELIID